MSPEKFDALAARPSRSLPRTTLTWVIREHSEAETLKGGPLVTTCSKRVQHHRQLKTQKYTYVGNTPSPVVPLRVGRRWRREAGRTVPLLMAALETLDTQEKTRRLPGPGTPFRAVTGLALLAT